MRDTTVPAAWTSRDARSAGIPYPAGQCFARRGAALEAGAWWCRSPEELVLAARRGTANRLARAVRQGASRTTNAELVTRSDVILNVIGRRTPAVLEAGGLGFRA